MGVHDPFVKQVENLWNAADAKPLTRWGIVATSSPLTVLVDPGLGVPAPAGSAIGGVAVGTRVLCVEQNRKLTVIGGGRTGRVDLSTYLLAGFTGTLAGRRTGNMVALSGVLNGPVLSQVDTVDAWSALPAGFRPPTTWLGPARAGGYSGHGVLRPDGTGGVSQLSGTDWATGIIFNIVFPVD